MTKQDRELAWNVAGWFIAAVMLVWLFCSTSGCYHPALTESEAAKRSLCVSEWLRLASEAPSCQQSLARLGTFAKTYPSCVTILGDADGKPLITLTCEEPREESAR